MITVRDAMHHVSAHGNNLLVAKCSTYYNRAWKNSLIISYLRHNNMALFTRYLRFNTLIIKLLQCKNVPFLITGTLENILIMRHLNDFCHIKTIQIIDFQLDKT